MTEKEEKAIEELKSLSPSEEAIETVLNLLEKKDKTIDLMSEEIAKTDDDLCEYIDQTTKNNNCRAEEDCINCIKQYFERKVENGN